ncbi:serine/threonine protein kinase [Nocardia uniformis]|uniref:non-specific serine/threonine protein kinase n=1 Tax=Nocardia uniformis TaxID=53432 RepID=A0A849C1F4_9NOCA|nr:serine/threonine-protein kinase [Nocardia uniformis]NNH71316.1 serine/threonine protein kinase [Nocardia uniformis]
MLEEGTTFAGYRIERRLGSGGMGAVFLARHPRLPRMDALKVLSDVHRGDEEFQARFLREAEVAARLQHPNLVAVRDRGEQDGHLWISMQYVDGADLAELIRGGPLVVPPPRMLHILTETARGLDEIHRAGLLHRDVKPANILVAAQPDAPDRVLVTDFGIARPADDSATIGDDGKVTATLAYAAPEQLSAAVLDHRVDVYALGCTLFEMLTGSVPFPRGSTAAVIYAHLHEPPPRPSERNPLIPAGFDTVIATALAKDPNLRYQNCRALAEAARAAAGGADPRGGSGAPPVPVPASAHSDPAALSSVTSAPSAPRRRRLIGATLLTVLLSVAAVLTMALRDNDTDARSNVPQTMPAPRVATEWGEYAYVAEAFPELLPFSPDYFGFRETRQCRPRSEGKEISFSKSVASADVLCAGDYDPVVTLDVFCNADRSAIEPHSAINPVEGQEKWTRSSGTGFARWGTFTTVKNLTAGYIEIFFDDPDRNFCYLYATSRTNGADLRNRWWVDVPV